MTDTTSAGDGGGLVTKAAADVLAERQRQRNAEGWTEQHDDDHRQGELAAAAACYAAPFRVFRPVERMGRDHEVFHSYDAGWPWDGEWWKPKDRRRDLVRAGALILAEIERIDRIPKGCVSAAPTGCVSDSECATVGRCLEAHP